MVGLSLPMSAYVNLAHLLLAIHTYRYACAGKVVVLESLPDSSCAPDLVPHTQPASSSRAAQAGGRVAGRTAAHVEPKQSAGQKRPSAAEITEVLEISDDDDNEFLPDPKVSRRN